MAQTNRKIADSDFFSATGSAASTGHHGPYGQALPVAYPEMQPVREQQRPARRSKVQSRQRKRATRGECLFYLGVNIALAFGLIQCVRAFIGDGLNLSRLMQSQASVQSFYSQTRQENQALQHKIAVYSSPSGVEELARNYLNMVGENELPVRFQ
jgi:cell division protein FtsB